MVAEDSRWAHVASVRPASGSLSGSSFTTAVGTKDSHLLSYLAVLALPDKICLAPTTTHLVHFLGPRSAGSEVSTTSAGG